MKKILFILLFISTTALAQQYEKKWSKVIQNENLGKTKTANKIVAEIFKNALAKKDEVQIIKCFFYKSKYKQTLEEDAQTKIIADLKQQITQVSIPSKSILNLIYATSLNDYLKNNRYVIRGHTNTISNKDNYLTWTNAEFEEKIKTLFDKTIENESILKTTPLTNYEPIFDFFTIDKFKNENLLNYMLQQNIEFYKEKINIWEVQSAVFEPYKHNLMGNSTDFEKLNLDFIKNENIKKALVFYQKIEANAPTFENQLERLQFCNSYLIKSDDYLLTVLISLQKNTQDKIQLQKIQLERALLYDKIATKEIHPEYKIKAIALLDSIIEIKNHSNSYKQAVQKKHQITFKNTTIQLQKNLYPNENSRAYISYKNVDSVTISFYKISQSEINLFKFNYTKKDSVLNELVQHHTPIIAQKYNLKNPRDYFEHTTEVVLPQLKLGTYLVFFENNTTKKDSKAYGFETIAVSNFTAIATIKNNKESYQVLDRKSGQPIEGVKVFSDKFSLTTNQNGEIIYDREEVEKSNLDLLFTKENDTLRLYDNQIQALNEYHEDQKTKARVELYLDRAIYRPGQTVYFKGIAFKKKENTSSIVANCLFKLTLSDPNTTTIKEIEVTTNEFGSFSGTFILPSTGLTGNFTIEAEEPDDYENDAIYDKENEEHPFWDKVEFAKSQSFFRVEEYKRPRFEISVAPLNENYKVNQKITVTGSANSFSGSTLSNAKVSYIISEETYNTNQNSRYEFYGGRSQIISQSETKTDQQGKFSIDFIAKPDSISKKEVLPIFSYRIKLTITDINGETQKKEQLITNVGYHTLNLTATIPNTIQTKDENSVTLESKNLNDTFVDTNAEVEIYRIRKAENKFKPRVWEKPEIESISDNEFEKLFPFEQNEKPLSGKETGELVFSKKINTGKDKEIALNFMSKYPSGLYQLVFKAVDAFNNNIVTKTDFNLIQSKETLNPNTLFTTEQLNTDPIKEGYVKIKISSIIPSLRVAVIANFQQMNFYEESILLNDNETIIKIPIRKEFEKEVAVNFTSIYENAVFKQDIKIALKKAEPKLDFEVESFRNKIEPGKLENWSFKLKATNTNLESEILASMYDKSLDQFTNQNWGKLNIDEGYHYYSSNTKTTLGFDKTYSNISNLNIYLTPIQLEDEDTKLIWFGFNFNEIKNNYTFVAYQKHLSKKAKKPYNAKLISGIISDESGVLPGASITVKGTERTTSSDFEGYYQIEAAPDEILVFNSIGYINKEQKISTNVMDIQLKQDQNNLEEVVVVGYGIQKKSMTTGAVRQVIEDDNQVYNTAGIALLLEEKAAGLSTADLKVIIRGTSSTNTNTQALYIIDGEIATQLQLESLNANDILSVEVIKEANAITLYETKGKNGAIVITTKKALAALSQVKARKNLSETAFFYPDLKTDTKGIVRFNFTSPEALTAWKMRLFAHNKNAVSGYLEKTVITQKELMITPNFPRFFREKDSISITTKIANRTKDPKIGIVVLQFFDTTTMQPIDSKMSNTKTNQNFTIPAFGNTTTSWKIVIPEGLQGVQYRILAKAGNFSDGEENILPVLTNNKLVTESIPVWVSGNSKKEYTFENLKNNTSTSLRNHQLILEYTSNPTWLALQSLPYLMEYEHQCAEQTFARFYANALASKIINSNPKIAAVFESWRTNGKLNSKLEENEELKSIILAETPWFNDAKTEEEKKQKLALLFDLEKMKQSQEATFNQLKQKQNPSGAFSWFDGSDENEYITRHILAGLGHLEKLNNDSITNTKIKEISKNGIPFLDRKFLEQYQLTIKKSKNDSKFVWIQPYSDLHYLYTRSFYLITYPLSDTLRETTKIYVDNIKNNWLNYSLYQKGMAALILNRFGKKASAKKIIESLKESASTNEDWGMYWISNKSGWYWYQAPIETQALLIEAFAEVNNDTKAVDAMKVWLLKNKQTTNWPTTKATTEAVYALLLQGTDWLSVKDNTIIKIGDEKILTKKIAQNTKEAETGYIKLNWKAAEIKKEMATITIENKSKVPGYGGIYWQYFEELDKIKEDSTHNLSVVKEIYLKQDTNKGEVLKKVSTTNYLKIGDLVTVRLLITAKENMEFVHLKDMRASCFEPVYVLSGYQYKAGLGFYKSTKDAATHFFFDQINKGTYVLEYDIRVNNIGDFSNGISTIESLYAPEFSSHTKGIRVQVKQ